MLEHAAAGMATEAFTDFVVGHGELWSALLFSATVKALGYDCQFMDTREVLVVTPTSDGNSVDIQYDLSNDRLDAWVRKNGAPEVIVATGFIAKNPLGQVTPAVYRHLVVTLVVACKLQFVTCLRCCLLFASAANLSSGCNEEAGALQVLCTSFAAWRTCVFTGRNCLGRHQIRQAV